METAFIHVKNLHPDTRDNAIALYFSNERRSCGGPVVKVDRLYKSHALVYFKSSLDAESVVEKGSHILDGRNLEVSLGCSDVYFSSTHRLQCDVRNMQTDEDDRFGLLTRPGHEAQCWSECKQKQSELSSYTRFSSSPYTMDNLDPYISERDNKETFRQMATDIEVDSDEELYRQHPAYALKRAGGCEAVCSENMLAKGLDRLVYPVEGVRSLPPHGTTHNTTYSSPPSTDYYRPNSQDSEVDSLATLMAGLQVIADAQSVMRSEDKQDDKKTTTDQSSVLKDEVIPNLKPAQMRILSLPQVGQRFREKCKDLVFEVDHSKLQLNIKAPENEVLKIKDLILTFIIGVCEKRIPTTAALTKMLGSKHAQDFVQAKIDGQMLTSCWEANSQSISMYGQPSELDKIQKTIESAFRQETISLNDDEMVVVTSAAWQPFVDEVEHPNRGARPSPLVNADLAQKSVIVVDITEEFDRTYRAVKTFFIRNKLEEIKLKTDPNKHRFLKQFCKEELTKLCEQEGVTLKLDREGQVIARGLQDSLSAVIKEVSWLHDNIKSEHKTLRGPGIAKYFNSQGGQGFLKHTGEALGCLVTVSSDQTTSSSQQEGKSTSSRHRHLADNDFLASPDRSLKDKSGLPIRIISGELARSKADVIVSTAHPSLDLQKGVLSRSILQFGGNVIQQELQDYFQNHGPAQLGKVVASSGGSLHCRHVYHLSLPMWYKDKGQVLKSAVEECLDSAHKQRAKSIAFPTLGTGKLGYPSDAVANIMYGVISKWLHSNSSSLEDIQIIVFSRDRDSLESFREAERRGAQQGRQSGHKHRDHGSSHRGKANENSDEKSRSGGGHGNSRMGLTDEKNSNDFYRKTVSRAEGSSSLYSSCGGHILWKSVQIDIYSLKREAVDKMMEVIDRHIKENQTTKREEDKIICGFSSQQQSAVMELQKKHEVDISLDTNRGAITVSGFEKNVLEAVSAVKDIKFSASKQHSVAAEMLAVRWQYEVGKDKYRDFDPEHIVQIETAFKKKESSVTLTDRRGRQYKIVFKDKKEYFLDDKSVQPVSVRRRDILEEKSQEIPLPSHWEPMKGQKVKLVDLSSSSSEYKRVQQHFGKMPVRKIQRVQNPTLFQQYKVKKKELEMHNPAGTENEKRLWHGADSKSLDSIITNGFNRSYCGKNGTAYGDGVYFATDAGYSQGFATDGKMLQARVLVGQSAPGQAGLRMPPFKPGSNRPYDSLTGPNMFVLFHDSQAYPEYLLTL